MPTVAELLRSAEEHYLAARYDRSIELLQTAERAAPDAVEPLAAMAHVFLHVGRDEEGVRALERAVRLDPAHVHIRLFLAETLGQVMRPDQGLQRIREGIALDPADPELRKAAAIALSYRNDADPAEIVAHLVARGRSLVAPYASRPHTFANTPDPERRLRIGYLCQDLRRESAIARFVAAPLLCLNRKAFELFGYCTEPTLAGMTRRLSAAVTNGWVDASAMSDDALLDRIRSDRIDILVETIGNTPGDRTGVLARRAAPVQITCIGDPRTTGLPTVDYRIVDAITDPPGSESQSLETLLRMPGCFLCYEPHESTPPSRPPIGANPSGPLVFGSFNLPVKVGDEVIQVWARIMRQTPGSLLFPKALWFGRAIVSDHFRRTFEAAGISADRIQILGRTPEVNDHLASYHRVDIALDPFPYNGTTTTCDSLWMGVPVVTLHGGYHPGRVGSSLLQSVGLPELVARSCDEYVEIALALARDRPRLAAIHRGLRAQMTRSPLCAPWPYAVALGDSFRQAWRAWCRARANTP